MKENHFQESGLIKGYEEIYHRYFSSLLIGSRLACHDIIADLMNQKISIKIVYQNFFKCSLYQIGELWEFNKISVAVEHIATSITEHIMNSIYPAIISSQRINKKAIICCVEGELHQIGGKMAADLLEMHGWDTIFLGANMPVHELIRFIHDTKPDVIGISFSVYFHLNNLEKMLTSIKNEFQDIDILVGGQAVSMNIEALKQRYPDVIWVPSLEALEAIIGGK